MDGRMDGMAFIYARVGTTSTWGDVKREVLSRVVCLSAMYLPVGLPIRLDEGKRTGEAGGERQRQARRTRQSSRRTTSYTQNNDFIRLFVGRTIKNAVVVVVREGVDNNNF